MRIIELVENIFSRLYLSIGQAIGMAVIRASLCSSVCLFLTDVLWLSLRS